VRRSRDGDSRRSGRGACKLIRGTPRPPCALGRPRDIRITCDFIEWSPESSLNIHQSASLVEWVARSCGIEEDLGKKGVRGVLQSQKTRQEFLSDLSHRIRFVYLPKHSSWLNQIEMVFAVVMRKVIRRGNFTSVEDLRAKLLAFMEYFNAVFAKPFRWTYTGRPLQK
jgi:transposase